MNAPAVKSLSNSHWDTVAFVLVALFVLGCRLPGCGVMIWHVDEAPSAVIANVILDGGLPYRDSVDHRGPVTCLVYAFIFHVAGRNNMFALHLALTGLMVVLVWLMWRLGRRALSPLGSAFSLLCFGLNSTFGYPAQDLMGFNTEWIVIAFTSAGTLLLWKGLDQRSPLTLGFFSGVCFALACFTKQPAGLNVLAALAWLTCLAWVGPGTGNGHGIPSRQICLLGIGVGMGGLVVATIIAGTFLVTGAWADFSFYAWEYNTKYYMASMPDPQKQKAMFNFLFYKILPTLVPLILLWIKPRRENRWSWGEGIKDWYKLYNVAWWVTSCVAVMLGCRNYGHYFILLLPAGCLLAGWWFESLILVPAAESSEERGDGMRRLRLLIGAVLLAGMCLPAANRSLRYLRQLTAAESPKTRAIVDFVRAETRKNDRILVWGFFPELYTRTDRKPSTRFSYTNFVAGEIPSVKMDLTEAAKWVVPGTQEIFVNEMRVNRPALIIDAYQERWGLELPIMALPAAAEIIAAEYEEISLDTRSPDQFPLPYRVYRRRTGGEN